MQSRPQQTIRRGVSVAGVGYWSGRPCRVEFLPAAAGAGIVFTREVGGVAVRIPLAVENRVEAATRNRELPEGHDVPPAGCSHVRNRSWC